MKSVALTILLLLSMMHVAARTETIRGLLLTIVLAALTVATSVLTLWGAEVTVLGFSFTLGAP